MASYSPSNIPQQDDMNCLLCGTPYDTQDHQAKYLPCLHTFCKSCLQNYASSPAELNCPSCGLHVTLPLEEMCIDSLPNDFNVENAKLYEHLCNSDLTCQNCNNDNPAKCYCEDCQCFQCEECIANHSRMNSMQNHKLVSFTELKESGFHQQMHCKKHPTLPLSMFCRKVTCNIAVCPSCVLIHHIDHDCVDLHDGFDMVKSLIQQSLKKLRHNKQALETTKAATEAMKEKVFRNFQLKVNKLQEDEEKMIKLIKRRYQNARDNLKDLKDKEMTVLSGHVLVIDSVLDQTMLSCKFADRACSMSHPTQLLPASSQIMDTLHKLENTPLPKTPLDNTDFTFTQAHHSAMNQMKKCFKYIGEMDSLNNLQVKIDPRQCKFDLKESHAVLLTKDSTGQPMTSGGADIHVTTNSGESLQIVDNNDGTYFIGCPVEGNFEPGIDIQINGIPMKMMGPFTAQKLPVNVNENAETLDFNETSISHVEKKNTANGFFSKLRKGSCRGRRESMKGGDKKDWVFM